MNKDEFRAALEELDLSQAGLAHDLSRASGKSVAAVTIWRYAAGKRKVPAGVAAYLKLRLKQHRRRS